MLACQTIRQPSVMADMSSSADLPRRFDIADRFLEHGLLLYFSGRTGGRVHAHLAVINHDYQPFDLDLDTNADSPDGAASAAAQCLNGLGDYGSRTAYLAGTESSLLGQAQGKLMQARLRVEWWAATAPSSSRRWGQPGLWVGLVYAPGGIVDVGVGSTPVLVAATVAAHLGLDIDR
jgi:hypothetical protein